MEGLYNSYEIGPEGADNSGQPWHDLDLTIAKGIHTSGGDMAGDHEVFPIVASAERTGPPDAPSDPPITGPPPITTKPPGEFGDFPESEVYTRVHQLGLPQGESVVIGSSALEVVAGPEVRRAVDTDLVVTDDAYRYLRDQPGMQEVIEPDNYRHLVGNGYDIATSWQGRTVADLQEGGFENQGIIIAGLPELYAQKQERGLPKDERDLETIRKVLLYGDKPLPPAMLGKELEFVRGLLPERLHDRKAEIHVAANGLYIVNTAFGNRLTGVRTYTGDVETRAVPSTYHELDHTAFGMERGQANYDALEAQGHPSTLEPDHDDNRLSSLDGYSYHDADLGHGRKARNPRSHDELRCANLVVRHQEAVGIANERFLESTHTGVIVTTYDEEKRSQDIEPSRGFIPVQHTNAASDLSAAREPSGPRKAAELAPEDLSRIGMLYDQPLTRLVQQLNDSRPKGAPPIRIRGADDAMRLADEHPDFPVTKAGATPDDPPQHMTLREAIGDHIAGSGGFFEKLSFPEMYVVGDAALQAESAAFLKDVGRRLKEGKITASEALAVTRAYEADHS